MPPPGLPLSVPCGANWCGHGAVSATCWRRVEITTAVEYQRSLKKLLPVNTERPSTRQLALIAVASGLPFVGFGIVDNAIMLVAGEDDVQTCTGEAHIWSAVCHLATFSATWVTRPSPPPHRRADRCCLWRHPGSHHASLGSAGQPCGRCRGRVCHTYGRCYGFICPRLVPSGLAVNAAGT